jgi:pyrrolidone-carboxylate peptidase
VPRRLLRDPVVTHSGDAGGFYCEHAFFTAQTLGPGCGVRRNRHGESLVGFLHVPGAHDRWMMAGSSATADPGRRHARTRIVVGRALAGFAADLHGADVAAADPDSGDPLRLLLTGYGPWGGVTDNPTGDFVGSATQLASALAHGFGPRLLNSAVLGGALQGAMAQVLSLDLLVAPERSCRLLVCGWVLPTSDEALDPAHPQSLPAALAAFRPHAVLSLGVARSRRRFYVEHTADDENLVDGRHQAAPARTTLPPNFALARAILGGGT